MTCAKCNHGFCWRCLKSWKPNHKDYYNCSAMVSKAARQEKRFQDYNERCTFHHQARDFAVNLRNRVSAIHEVPPPKSFTFLSDACRGLEQARKVLAYACVYSFYNQDTEHMDVVEQQIEALELHTNALQILLGEPPSPWHLPPKYRWVGDPAPAAHLHSGPWSFLCLVALLPSSSSTLQVHDTHPHPTFALITTCPHL